MSGNSANNSDSLQKGFFKRMLRQEPSKNATKQSEVKQRHPAFTVSNDVAVTPGRTVRPHEIMVSPAVKQLNRDGYIVYNTPEKQDVYIAIQPESAFFDDEEPKMVKMAGGSFVGAEKQADNGISVRSEQELEQVEYTQPADIFCNACRRKDFEEIDFNEVIIKKNSSFETEFENPPPLFEPSYEGVPEPVMEEAFKMGTVNEAAMTSSAGVVMEIKEISIADYSEEPDYMVEKVPMAEKAPVTEVPAGLYVDGYRQIDIAEADTDEEIERELMSFKDMMSIDFETAMTSEAAQISDIVQPSMGCLSLPSLIRTEPQEEAASEIAAEEAEQMAEPVCDVVTEETESVAEPICETIEAETEPEEETVCDIIEIETEQATEQACDVAEAETEPAEEQVCDIISTETEPVAEPICDIVSEETEPATEQACDIISIEVESVTEPACEIITEEAEPIAEPVCDIVSEETESITEPACENISEEEEPIAESVCEVVAVETDPAMEPICEVVAEEAEPIAELACENVATETEPVAEPVCEAVTVEAEPAVESVCEAAAEEGSETVTGVPAQIDILDEVSDIMKITIPSLRMGDELMLELAQDWGNTIPEDGLEAYDCVFRPMRTPV